MIHRLPRLRGRAAVRVADPHVPLLLLLGQAGAGLGAGVVWWVLTRRPPEWLVGEPVVTSPLFYAVARDGTFAVIAVLLGLAAGVGVLRRGDVRPVPVLLAAVCGALAGALLMAGTGAELPPRSPLDPEHVGLTAWGVVLLWPFALCALVTAATLASEVGDWVSGGGRRSEPDVTGTVARHEDSQTGGTA